MAKVGDPLLIDVVSVDLFLSDTHEVNTVLHRDADIHGPPRPQSGDHRRAVSSPADALQRYEACVGDRVSEFPPNRESFYKIVEDREIPYSHRLSYDAESIFWLLLSWAIQVKPIKGGPDNRIPQYVWGELTGGEGTDDPRSAFLARFPPALCHPTYQGLEQLLRSLCKQLSGYQELGARPLDEQDEPDKTKEEYLHEAFQRTIFDFIMKTINEPFMKEPISPTRRRKEDGGDKSQSRRTPSIGGKRDRQTMEGPDVQSSD
jgi:hypothetical protein